jgi:hypothetical protein
MNDAQATQARVTRDATKEVTDGIRDLTERLAVGTDVSEAHKLSVQLMRKEYEGVPAALKQTWLGLAQLIDKQREEADTAKTLQSVLDYSNQKLLESQLKLSVINDPDAGGFANFVGGVRKSLEKLKGVDKDQALQQLRSAFDQIKANDKEFRATHAFNEYISGIDKELAVFNAKNELQAFTAGLMEVNEAGKLVGTQLSKEQIQAMFNKKKFIDQLMELRSFLADFRSGVQDVFKSMFDSIWQNGFKGLFNNVINGFNKLLQDMAAKWLASQLARLFMKGLGWVIGQLGGDTTGLDEFFRAKGGPISAGRAYLVGEHGPELVVPQGSGTVLPTSRLAMAGGGAVTNQNFYIQTPDAGSFRRSQTQILQQSYAAAQREHRRTAGGRIR